MYRPFKLNNRGFTLIEVMVIVAIICVLCFLSFSVYGKIIRRAENAKCVGRMKNIHVALANYVGTNLTWPQLPPSMEEADEEQHWKYWAETMEPYGVPEREWLCPTDDRQRKADYAKEGKKRDKYEGSYVPTNFEQGADIPYKWRQPWLIERGDFHGNGMNAIFPDGSIFPFPNPGGTPTK
jgi:prepilin-type N-terminal cleavage/methylation domain-containing protein